MRAHRIASLQIYRGYEMRSRLRYDLSSRFTSANARRSAKLLQRGRLLLGIVRARSSAPLVNAGRTGILRQFFTLLRKSEDVTDTRAFGPLGN